MSAPDSPDQDLIATIETIPPPTCWNLFATTSFGRVGLLVDDKPEVLPVNYAIDGESILFRTGEATVLTQANLRVVAFQADYVDPRDHSGWSVMVQGFARDIGDAVDANIEAHQGTLPRHLGTRNPRSLDPHQTRQGYGTQACCLSCPTVTPTVAAPASGCVWEAMPFQR